jgi:hypothetical protein
MRFSHGKKGLPRAEPAVAGVGSIRSKQEKVPED